MNNQNQEIYAVQIFDKKDKVGLHARPVSAICQITNEQKYKSNNDVKIIKLEDDIDLNNEIELKKQVDEKIKLKKYANGQSILSIIALGIKHNNKIAFVITGPDSKQIIEEIKKILVKLDLIA